MPDESNTGRNRQHIYCYFNGGGSFLDGHGTATNDGHTVSASDLDSSVAHYTCRPIAWYQDVADSPVAAVSIRAGSGRAILSGVHVEYSPQDLDPENTFLRDRMVVERLTESREGQGIVLEAILKELGLDLSKHDSA